MSQSHADHCPNDECIVATQYGPVRGDQRITLLGDQYYSFRGIPYAQPPVGQLRFRDPQPPAAWIDPLDATQSIVSAPYLNAGGAVAPHSSEDCLVVNVYTKSIGASAAPQPVMVWLHGGAFKAGSSSDHVYGPDFLLPHDVVLVTLNYRLGALGFLSLDQPLAGVPGNAGLKDQTLALRWVRANIAAFGGDAGNVTVFGNSAGGCSVHLHMLSEHSAGLFDKAISQSGTALAEWANYPRNDWARRLALRLGWSGAESSDSADDTAESLLAFLQRADVADILREQDAILTMDERMDGISTFGPATEPYIAEQCFMPVAPEAMLQRGVWSAHVPLIIGGNSDEGLLFYRIIASAPQLFQSLAGFERTVPIAFGIPRGTERSRELACTIRAEYYGDEPATVANMMRTLQIWGDKTFWHGIGGAVRARLATSGAATYLYRFAVESPWFDWHKRKYVGDATVKGTSHVDEVVYLFKHPRLTEPLPTECKERTMVCRMTDMWTNFARTGNPNMSGDVGIVQWQAVADDAGALKCLNIADELTFIELPEDVRIRFWDRLFEDNGISN